MLREGKVSSKWVLVYYLVPLCKHLSPCSSSGLSIPSIYAATCKSQSSQPRSFKPFLQLPCSTTTLPQHRPSDILILCHYSLLKCPINRSIFSQSIITYVAMNIDQDAQPPFPPHSALHSLYNIHTCVEILQATRASDRTGCGPETPAGEHDPNTEAQGVPGALATGKNPKPAPEDEEPDWNDVADALKGLLEKIVDVLMDSTSGGSSSSSSGGVAKAIISSPPRTALPILASPCASALNVFSTCSSA